MTSHLEDTQSSSVHCCVEVEHAKVVAAALQFSTKEWRAFYPLHSVHLGLSFVVCRMLSAVAKGPKGVLLCTDESELLGVLSAWLGVEEPSLPITMRARVY